MTATWNDCLHLSQGAAHKVHRSRTSRVQTDTTAAPTGSHCIAGAGATAVHDMICRAVAAVGRTTEDRVQSDSGAARRGRERGLESGDEPGALPSRRDRFVNLLGCFDDMHARKRCGYY